MPAGRHRKTSASRLWSRRLGAVALPTIAVAAAMPVVSALGADGNTRPTAATSPRGAALPQRVTTAARASRGLHRDAAPPRPAEVRGLSEIAIANDRSLLRPRWSTARLALRVDPRPHADPAGAVRPGTKVLVAGEVERGWVQVVRDDQLVWARADDLARSRPAEGTEPVPTEARAAGVTTPPCADGSSVEAGLVPNAVKVYRAVCAAFPAVTSWGGRSAHGEHSTGRALDIMSSGAFGQSIAEWVRAHAGELGVAEVIYAQHIWTVQRSSEGWRPMADRGSTTANHYDHVHVSVY